MHVGPVSSTDSHILLNPCKQSHFCLFVFCFFFLKAEMITSHSCLTLAKSFPRHTKCLACLNLRSHYSSALQGLALLM